MTRSSFSPTDTTYADIGLLLAEAKGLRSRVAAQSAISTGRDDGSDVDVTALAILRDACALSLVFILPALLWFGSAALCGA